jgi:hypothetical protein
MKERLGLGLEEAIILHGGEHAYLHGACRWRERGGWRVTTSLWQRCRRVRVVVAMTSLGESPEAGQVVPGRQTGQERSADDGEAFRKARVADTRTRRLEVQACAGA